MSKPLLLNRLPKAGRLRAIRFRRTTPGTFWRLFGEAPADSKTQNGALDVLDKTHPWANQQHRNLVKQLPSFSSPIMKIRAYPKALLAPPTRNFSAETFPPAPKTPYGKDGKALGRRKKINVSMMFSMGKKLGPAVVRLKMKSKIKSALALLVTRGATVEKIRGKEQLVESDEDNGEKWVMQDWTYVVTPTLEIYRMPFLNLIANLQKALEPVNAKCRNLEHIWKLQTLRPRPVYTEKAAQSKRRNVPRSGVGAISQMKTLMQPYASTNWTIDDVLLEDEDDSFTAKRKSSEPRVLIQAKLPPRRTERPEIGFPLDESRRNATKTMYSRPILKPLLPKKEQRFPWTR